MTYSSLYGSDIDSAGRKWRSSAAFPLSPHVLCLKLQNDTHYISSSISTHKHTHTCALHSNKKTKHKCHTEILTCIPGPGPVGNKYQSNMFVYARHYKNPHSNSFEPDWPQHDHPTVCVIPRCSLPPPSSQCAFLPSRKKSVQISIMSLLLVFFHFFRSLKASILKMCCH